MSDVEKMLAQAAAKLGAAERVLLTCHRGPDGDSVGSMVALASILRRMGKHATLYSPDLVPRQLKWLPHIKTWSRKLKKDAKYEVTVTVDCGDRKLLGDQFPKPDVTGELIALDHHAKVRPFGDLFICDPGASSCGVLIARMAGIAGWELCEDSAKGIYLSLVSDTGSFRYSNTNAEALQLAARLVGDFGVSPWSISERLDEQVPLKRYRLLSRAFSEIELALEDRVAFVTVTQKMLDETGAAWEDTEGLANRLRAIRGVDCGVLMTPAKWGGVRVSLRSKGQFIDAGAVCHGLGGGGHVGAAGCTLPGELGEARKTVEQALSAAITAASVE